jgi:hypothetical protein
LTTLHAMGALVVFAAAVLVALGVTAAGLRGGAAWVDAARNVVLGIVVLQAAIGAVAYLGGSRPAEPLHFVYGLAAIAVLPLAATFASEAPPRPRAWVLVVALAILLVLAWRLASTG